MNGGDARPHSVYVIGDWGGVLYGGVWVAPADHRSQKFKGHQRKFVKGADDSAQRKVAEAMMEHAVAKLSTTKSSFEAMAAQLFQDLTLGKAYQDQCQKCGNIFMSDSLYCRHCGAKREEMVMSKQSPPMSTASLAEEEQGQILVERKIEAFRQLAANLDAQVIDQIVDEHNRRLLGSTGTNSGALQACQNELEQCKEGDELLAFREQELADCREELRRLQDYSAALEERDQKLSAAVHQSVPVLDQVQKNVSFSTPTVQPTIAAVRPAPFLQDFQDLNHGVAEEFVARTSGGSSPGRCMVQIPQATAPSYASHTPAQDLLFQRIDANRDGVISAEEAFSHCPQCGNLYMADSIFCRQCGRRRD
eukprot:symbB.v1.2.030572.t1/scaffold3463.1/size92345/2